MNCKNILIVLVTLSGLWTANNLYADDVIVFENIKQVAEDLAELKSCKDEQALKDALVKTLNSEIELLNKKIETMDRLIQSQETAIDNFKKIIETQKEGYEEYIKVSKPSLLDEIKKGGLFTGIGIIIGIILSIGL